MKYRGKLNLIKEDSLNWSNKDLVEKCLEINQRSWN